MEGENKVMRTASEREGKGDRKRGRIMVGRWGKKENGGRKWIEEEARRKELSSHDSLGLLLQSL